MWYKLTIYNYYNKSAEKLNDRHGKIEEIDKVNKTNSRRNPQIQKLILAHTKWFINSKYNSLVRSNETNTNYRNSFERSSPWAASKINDGPSLCRDTWNTSENPS